VRVLGVDPGTAITGYGIVDETPAGLTLVHCGTIRTHSDESMPARLRHIFHEMRALIEHHAPAALAVEQLFFNTNVTTAMTVGQARGVCLLAAEEMSVPVYEYTPLEVKQAVAGYGRADKRQMQEMVRMLLGLPEVPRPDDAADAVAVAICHLHSAHMRGLMDAFAQ